MKNLNAVVIAVLAVFLGLFVGRYWGVSLMYRNHMTSGFGMMAGGHEMDGAERDHFIAMKNQIIGELTSGQSYKCCLEKPCTYCIEKTPGHGEGASCNCLDDIVNGVHPCGECIGEILEGHGNRFLAKYFAEAISEEVGPQYKDTIKQIISDKYDISPEEQV